MPLGQGRRFSPSLLSTQTPNPFDGESRGVESRLSQREICLISGTTLSGGPARQRTSVPLRGLGRNRGSSKNVVLRADTLYDEIVANTVRPRLTAPSVGASVIGRLWICDPVSAPMHERGAARGGTQGGQGRRGTTRE